jgi:eukaryotic-like serine/threonine-protein kinase
MSDWTGQQVGTYRVIRLLEHETMIDWYLGYDESAQRHVTLLLAAPTDEAGIFRFQRNLPITRRLVHPHIAPLLDAGVQDWSPFVALDHLPTSRQAHPFPLPLPTVVRYVSQLAEALAHAHHQGVWPNYTTPETILIGSRGEALLAGCGVRLLEISQSMQYGKFPAPLAYLSPEQVSDRTLLHPSIDQHALATVAYEWLGGVPLFQGAQPLQIALQIIQAPPPSLREKVLMLPPAVEQVIVKALAKSPEERFTTIQAFSQALLEASKPALDGPTQLT